MLSRCIKFTMALLASFGLSAGPVGASPWQDHDQIRRAVADTLRTERMTSGSRVDVVVDELDRRVRLPACAEPLSVTVPFARKQTTRITAEVSCPGPRPWRLYVPSRLSVFERVVVASRPLARGDRLSAADLETAERPIARLAYGYLPKPDHAVGRELRRPIAAGDAITPNMLVAARLIRRGQRVALHAEGSGLQVVMAAVARSDGVEGQIIDVENLASGRRVQAIVRSAKRVEVLLR